jgi:hypothetical protein
LFAIGCGNSKGDLQFKENRPATNSNVVPSVQIKNEHIDYAYIESAVLKPYCLNCHSGKEDPLLTDYQKVSKNIRAIEQAVFVHQSMPPKKVLPDYLSLQLRAWIDAGAPLLRSSTDDGSITDTAWPSLSRQQKGCADLKNNTFKKTWRLLARDNASSSGWEKIEESAKKSLEKCRQKNVPAVYLGCFDNLLKLSGHEKQTHRNGHSMQFLLPNLDYIARQPKEMLAFPTELQNGLPSNWEEICEKNKWHCLKFVSASLPNPPKDSFWRLIISVPGELFDRWMLFTLPSNGKGTEERLIDFMAVETHRNSNGIKQKLARPLLHFTEYWRDSDGTKPVLRKDIASCYKCHPNGMRDIVPAVGSVDVKGLKKSQFMNNIMKNYGDVDWGESINISAFGPAMGERQGCVSCHNGRERGALNAAHLGERSRHQLYFKMVQDLSMPPNLRDVAENKNLFGYLNQAYELSAKERYELYKPERLHTLFQYIPLGLGGDKGPVAESKKEILEYLKEIHLISKSEFSDATAQLKKNEDKMKLQYEQMMNDYELTLKKWLQGDRQECLGLF